jgi:hypothetical protein
MDLGTSETDNGKPAYTLNSSENVPRWGTNVIQEYMVTSTLTPHLPGSASAYTFTTTFNSNPSTTIQEAQATLGDSGGGVFENFGGTQSGDTWIGGTWYLVGLIDGIPDSSPVPANDPDSDWQNNVYVGEQSTIIDLAYYNTIIAAAMVPEPSSFVLCALGAGIALLVGLQARRRRLAQLSPALSAKFG